MKRHCSISAFKWQLAPGESQAASCTRRNPQLGRSCCTLLVLSIFRASPWPHGREPLSETSAAKALPSTLPVKAVFRTGIFSMKGTQGIWRIFAVWREFKECFEYVQHERNSRKIWSILYKKRTQGMCRIFPVWGEFKEYLQYERNSRKIWSIHHLKKLGNI